MKAEQLATKMSKKMGKELINFIKESNKIMEGDL